MTSAIRLRNMRQRLEKQRQERLFNSGEPTWLTHARYLDGVKLFRQHVGDPAKILGDQWEYLFLPWHAMIAGYPADMRAEFEKHQADDAKEFDPPSWSFGEMVARQAQADRSKG